MAVSAQGGRPHEFARPDSASGEAFRTPILLPGRRTVLFPIYKGAAGSLGAVDLRTGAITRLDQPGFGPQWVDDGFVVLGNADGTLIARAVRRRARAGDRAPGDDRPGRLAAGRLLRTGRGIGQRLDHLPEVRRRRAAAAHAGVALGPGDPARRRAEGVCLPALRSGRPAGRALHRRPGHRQPRRVGARRRPGTCGRASRPTGSATSPSGPPTGGAWCTRATTTCGGSRPTGAPAPRACSCPSGATSPGASRPTAARSCSRNWAASRAASARSRSIRRRPAGPSYPRPSTNPRRRSRPTVIGWRTSPTRPGGWRCTSRSYPVPGGRVPVSLQGGTEPVWAHNGRELFYRAGDSLMVGRGDAVAGVRGHRAAAACSAARSSSGGSFREYDVAPDDQHFVMITGGAAQSTLFGMQNVFQRLVFDRDRQR